MKAETIIDIPKDVNSYQALKQLILEGAGKQDVIGRHARHCDVTGKNNKWMKWMQYEEKTEQKHAQILVPELEQYTTLKNKNILDFGSGTGGSAVAIAAKGAVVTGVEPIYLNYLASIKRAKMYGFENRIKFIYCPDTSTLPFENMTFDICYANSVFEYIPDQRQKYLLEIWRILKEDGLLFITDTSNGIYPVELHTGRVLINYLPKKTKRLKLVRGVTYWEIKNAFAECHYSILNSMSNDDKLRKYFYRKSRVLLFERRLLYTFCRCIDKTICRVFCWPIDAFFPWLNIVLRKEGI